MTTSERPPPALLRCTNAKVLPPDVSAGLRQLAPAPLEQLSAIREFLARPHTPGWAVDAINRVLRDRDHLTEIAAQSFAHPNGFDSIPLENSLPSHRVRLHIWWPETELVIEDVHDHTASFASVELSGQLRFEILRESPAGTTFYHYTYQAGRDSADEPGQGREVAMDVVFDGTFTPGSHYSFEYQQRHRVTALKSDRPVSTLAVFGATQRTGSNIFTQRPRPGDGYRRLRNPYTADQLAERLRRYLDGL